MDFTNHPFLELLFYIIVLFIVFRGIKHHFTKLESIEQVTFTKLLLIFLLFAGILGILKSLRLIYTSGINLVDKLEHRPSKTMILEENLVSKINEIVKNKYSF